MLFPPPESSSPRCNSLFPPSCLWHFSERSPVYLCSVSSYHLSPCTLRYSLPVCSLSPLHSLWEGKDSLCFLPHTKSQSSWEKCEWTIPSPKALDLIVLHLELFANCREFFFYLWCYFDIFVIFLTYRIAFLHVICRSYIYCQYLEIIFKVKVTDPTFRHLTVLTIYTRVLGKINTNKVNCAKYIKPNSYYKYLWTF